ncbi:hypothetical protein BKA82DRAFT_4338527 [Pisolithus tinctorius]|nr:hypothetical protein BKA82DRAFT_4338527 [Pisolithus tinctorius]
MKFDLALQPPTLFWKAYYYLKLLYDLPIAEGLLRRGSQTPHLIHPHVHTNQAIPPLEGGLRKTPRLPTQGVNLLGEKRSGFLAPKPITGRIAGFQNPRMVRLVSNRGDELSQPHLVRIGVAVQGKMAIPAEIDLTDVHMKPGRIRRRSFVPSEEADHFQAQDRVQKVDVGIARFLGRVTRIYDASAVGLSLFACKIYDAGQASGCVENLEGPTWSDVSLSKSRTWSAKRQAALNSSAKFGR